MRDPRTAKIRALEAVNASLRRDALAMSERLIEGECSDSMSCGCVACTAARRLQGLKRERCRRLVRVG